MCFRVKLTIDGTKLSNLNCSPNLSPKLSIPSKKTDVLLLLLSFKISFKYSNSVFAISKNSLVAMVIGFVVSYTIPFFT